MPWNRCCSFFDGKEFLVESIFADLCFMLKPFRIFMEILCFRISAHHLANIEIISRRDESSIRNSGGILTMNQFFSFRWHTPITISVFLNQSVFLVLVFQMLQPSLDVGIILSQGSIVAIMLHQHVE